MKTVIGILCFGLCGQAVAQNPVDLPGLYARARAADPRIRQLDLAKEQAELRVLNILGERRPALFVEGLAQYQSEVVELPGAASGGPVPHPPRNALEAGIRLEQWLIDPTLDARVELERSRLDGVLSELEVRLFALRSEVDDAFFSAAMLQEQIATIELAIRDLQARLREARLRVEQGVALPSEPASIEALLLERERDLASIEADRSAAIARLAHLVGKEIGADDTLMTPELASMAARAIEDPIALLARPELERFTRAAEQLSIREQLLDARDEPRVSAYAKAAYGRPGLNFLDDDFHGWWLGGVRVQWQPFDWSAAERERRILELERESIASEREHFVSHVRRSIERDVATIRRLEETRSMDERIIALRELIEKETRARLEAGVVTAADYVDRYTDLLEARLVAARHRVELARASARLLTALGVEVG